MRLNKKTSVKEVFFYFRTVTSLTKINIMCKKNHDF